MEDILTVKELSKTYRNGRKALDNLNFNVYKGEILGFLGPNGAGKSTTINILSTLLKCDQGDIQYFNNSELTLKEVKQKLGIVPQELAIYEDDTAFQNVKFFASLYGVNKNEIDKKVEDALDKVGLQERRDDKASTFSGGMKRRLNIACAIVHNPELIIFDEPTVGIDPQSRNHILQSIQNLRQEGATIIYTTHYMEEVQAICDRVIIMDGGVILLNDNLNKILEDNSASQYAITTSLKISEEVLQKVNELEEVKSLELTDESTVVLDVEDNSSLNRVLEMLIENNVNIISIAVHQNNLEDVFLSLTGKKLRD
ncbi:ABC transporter ATP-binding protein [Pseudolactococcus plantarum]|uniref:ABC transporter ATPase n=1 Tax=Pseudolactococcus plantarum TaxID=1365 RepID=A0A2A5S197_9LACT|nr:ABC transporter ATP-binding protein [Lactococcus plantarum]PCS07235.1 ABC transporter ATPase [Lactococcus plantarum]HCN74965.1 ABC transporter ATP-binding protein [Lactococcus sp.]